MVEYRIDRHSGVATYVQIVQQTKQALRLGVLRPGDKLPTAREVVEATAINPNTVLKAYRELERDGLVEARRGLGTFVRRGLSTAPADSPLRSELGAWAVRAREAGLDREDVAALFTAVLDEHFTTAPKPAPDPAPDSAPDSGPNPTPDSAPDPGPNSGQTSQGDPS
ncbi:GntR family transcriptional regulator [Streptomyces sp. Amel2xC10]|uniref:GntR family transcriptional regulator n=1 Tax=Streptomyces sp. Amel2xC10 TaxID=1305826 RepID=UPI000A083988|nr:GntR family transcriptional regulator [Streptomyces sp. Amel2xC10]SMF69298.1 GntR family transcriptional regulator [Streptomyces sp. Amel2xC10]